MSKRKRAQGISALATCQNIQNCVVDFLTEIRYTENEEMAEIPSLTISQDVDKKAAISYEKQKRGIFSCQL